MSKMTRREFSRLSFGMMSAGILTPAWLRSQYPIPRSFDYEIGFQTWVVREMLAEDFAGTLKKMAGLGYETMELCSPHGYTQPGFSALKSLSARELKNIINENGLTCKSSHYLFNELKDHGQERIDFAGELGLSQMVVSSFGLRGDVTLDDWKRAADEMNALGELGAKNGMQMGFHNHNGEFAELEGQLIYDVLMQRLDPTLVKMQFQVWVVSIGFEAADYFRKYPGRFISAHLSDWSGVDEERVPVGQGKVDWPDFFEASQIGGVKNIYVEMDPSLLAESAAYLKSLR